LPLRADALPFVGLRLSTGSVDPDAMLFERGEGGPNQAPGSAVTGTGPVVVVVDDDDSLRGALERLLDAAGFRPETYVSAEALLSAGLRQDAACVVTDLKLPGMSGLELLDALKSRGADVPVVLITAHDAAGMAEAVRRRGAAAYIAKPFPGTALLRVIRSLLGPVPAC
jgi:FixJ family two-component response regulator